MKDVKINIDVLAIKNSSLKSYMCTARKYEELDDMSENSNFLLLQN